VIRGAAAADGHPKGVHPTGGIFDACDEGLAHGVLVIAFLLEGEEREAALALLAEAEKVIADAGDGVGRSDVTDGTQLHV
jgi:hypothetical protein